MATNWIVTAIPAQGYGASQGENGLMRSPLTTKSARSKQSFELSGLSDARQSLERPCRGQLASSRFKDFR